MAVVDLKVPKRTKRGLPLDQASGAARFFGRRGREIESDLGGHRMLSRIQRELLHAFAGAATQIQYLNGRRIVPVRTRSIIRATLAMIMSMRFAVHCGLSVGSRPCRSWRGSRRSLFRKHPG